MTTFLILAIVITYAGIAVWMYPTLLKRWAYEWATTALDDRWENWVAVIGILGSIFWPVNTIYHFVFRPMRNIHFMQRSKD